MLAHVLGLPLEESVLLVAPAGAAVVTVAAIEGRTMLDRLRRRLFHRRDVQEEAQRTEEADRPNPERPSELPI